MCNIYIDLEEDLRDKEVIKKIFYALELISYGLDKEDDILRVLKLVDKIALRGNGNPSDS